MFEQLPSPLGQSFFPSQTCLRAIQGGEARLEWLGNKPLDPVSLFMGQVNCSSASQVTTQLSSSSPVEQSCTPSQTHVF